MGRRNSTGANALKYGGSNRPSTTPGRADPGQNSRVRSTTSGTLLRRRNELDSSIFIQGFEKGPVPAGASGSPSFEPAPRRMVARPPSARAEDVERRGGPKEVARPAGQLAFRSLRERSSPPADDMQYKADDRENN